MRHVDMSFQADKFIRIFDEVGNLCTYTHLGLRALYEIATLPPEQRDQPHTDAFTACIIDCIRRYKLGYIDSLESYIFASVRKLSRRLYLEEVKPCV